MTRIRKALLGAFFAACVLVSSPHSAARATQYTNQVTLSTTGYTDLGAGPLQIVAPAVGLVFVIVSDAQPSAAAVGDPIAGNSGIGRYVYSVTSHVWARAANSPLTIVVTGGLASGGGGSVTAPGTSGTQAQAVQGITGGVPVPVSGTFSATLGGFAPGGVYAALSPSTTSSNVALPSGAVVVVYNNGASDAFLHLGTTNAVTATTANDVVKAGGAVSLTVGSNTYLAAITLSGTTSLNVSGGAGLFTAYGAAASGGGGGTVAQGSPAAVGNAWPFYIAQGGAANAVGNPIFTQITNFPATQPISAAALPLPTGAATAANQNVTAAGTTATSAQGIQGVTGGVSVSVQQGAASQSNPWFTTMGASQNIGGVANFSRIPSSAATTNATVAKASAGRVYKITGYNTGTTVLRIKFYNVTTTPTPGTTTIFFVKPLPPGAFSFEMSDLGWYFSTGISYALLTNAADSDTTAIAAGSITDLEVEYQ